MTKKFFTKVSPKAAKGIMRVYESRGYEVRAKPQSDGDFVVVVMKNEGTSKRGTFGRGNKAKAERVAA